MTGLNFHIQTTDEVFYRYWREPRHTHQIWFIHGFPESGLSFREAFSSKLKEKFDLYAPDTPGFGASPSLFDSEDPVEFATEQLLKIIKKESQGKKIGIVSHSWGGVIAVDLIERLKDQVIGLIDVEGPLSPMVLFFEEKIKEPNLAAIDFSHYYYTQQEKLFFEAEAYKRYYASIRLAENQTLLPWIKSCLPKTTDKKIGKKFLKLSCPKIEFYGLNKPRPPLLDFVEQEGIENICFSNSGHWPMIDETEKFYSEVNQFFSKLIQ